MSLLEFLVASLAVFRLTRLVVSDEIFSPIRDSIWKRFPPERGGIGYAITCYWCSSIWLASAFVLSSNIAPTFTRVSALVLALSSMTGLLAAYGDN